jgi:hypothetical protein
VGEVYKGITESDNELIAGTSYIIVDTETDQETGDSKIWVTAFFYPALIEGTWIVPGNGEITSEGASINHRGHGVRDLQGLRIRFEVLEPEDPGTPPCEPLFPPVQLEGVIIDLP